MATLPPTQEVFDQLLLCLNPDRERAGEEYELLRLKLLEYFRARSCQHADELVDETLNRLARKVAGGEEIREMGRYCYGLARFVWKESLRDPKNKLDPIDDAPLPPVVTPDRLIEKERLACFQHCLQSLTVEERELMVSYWEHDEQPHSTVRRELAARLGISPVALRIRVSRIKNKFKACFANCLERGLADLKRS